MNQQLSFWIFKKSALFSAVSEEISAVQLWISAVSEKISAETALFQRWFLVLKISVFSAVQSWISAVQIFSGNEQRWNRPESILNQSWSALNVSETSTREVFFVCQFLKANWKTPGNYMKIFSETWKTSQQQTKLKHAKFHKNCPKSFKRCLVTYKNLTKLSLFSTWEDLLSYVLTK